MYFHWGRVYIYPVIEAEIKVMEKAKANLKQQLEAQANGIYLDSDGNESQCYNFYDWFCKDRALKNKAKSLYGNVRTFLKHSPHIDTEKVYVFFKNNCPMSGRLYDDFRICDIETGDVIYNVTPRNGHTGTAQIYFSGAGFEKPTAEADTYRELFKS